MDGTFNYCAKLFLQLFTIHRFVAQNSVPQSEIGKWLKNLFCLSFLNSEVGVCLVKDFISTKPQDSKVERMLDYLVDSNVDNDTTFPPRIWAARDSSLSRTTSACESFPSKFNAE
nr:unnamed protein product [Callosobruchus analis]